MNTRNIIQQGEEAKYQIAIEREGFSQHEDDFCVILSWGMKGDTLTIGKSQMMEDEREQFFFTFPTDKMLGPVVAAVEWQVPDTDYADGYRTEREQQPLCFVNASARMPAFQQSGLYDGRYVAFTRVQRSYVQSLYCYLRDVLGRPLRELNGLRLRALKKN